MVRIYVSAALALARHLLSIERIIYPSLRHSAAPVLDFAVIMYLAQQVS